MENIYWVENILQNIIADDEAIVNEKGSAWCEDTTCLSKDKEITHLY